MSVPRIAAAFAGALAIMVLAGWMFDIRALTSVLPGSPPMKMNTAIAFLLAAAALSLTRRPGGRVAAALVTAIGATALSEYVFGWDLHIDQLLAPDPEAVRAPGRMAFTTAAALMLLGVALALAPSRPVLRRRAAEALGAVVALFAVFELEGYVFGTGGPEGYTKMALHTALGLTALAMGTIVAVPDGWLAARVTDPGSGGILTRRLLLAAIVLPLVLGAAGVVGEQAGWLDAKSSLSFMVSLTILLLLAASVWTVSTVEGTERARRETEDQFRWFFEESPVGLSITAPDGRLRANRAFRDILGYSAAEMQHVPWMDITHPEDLAISQEAVRRLAAGDVNVQQFEKRYRSKDGPWVWVQISIGTHRGPDGKPSYFLTHVQDIGKRKELEQGVADSERYFRALTEQALDLTTLVDANAFVTYASPSYHTVLGYRPEEVIGQRVFDFVHPDDLAATLDIFTDGSATPQATRAHEFRFRHHDGSWRVIAAVGRNLFDDPVIHAAIINGRDITDKRRMQEHEQTLLRELQLAMSEVKVLQGILPICASCKRIKDDHGKWEAVESYVREHTNAEFSHGLCPDCAKKTWG